MKSYITILTEKLQKYQYYQQVTFDKYEYLTSEEIITSDKSRIIEHTKFPLGKTFEKQIKTTKEQEIKQVKALNSFKPEENKEDIISAEGIFPKDMRTNEIENEIYELKKWEEKIKEEDLNYKTKTWTYGFQQYERIRSSGDNIYTGKINVDKAEMDQSNLLKNIVEFYNKTRQEH